MKIALFPIIVCHKSGNGEEAIEQIDEDIAVTQSQMNFICPITQVCCHCIIDWEIVISYSSLMVYYRSAILVKIRQYQLQALLKKSNIAWEKPCVSRNAVSHAGPDPVI